MIHTFSVSNYRSIREEVVLDLRIPDDAPDRPGFRRSQARPDVRLPTVAVLVGANGSGKTTVLEAMVAFASLILLPERQRYSRTRVIPFAVKEMRREPTRFCMELEADWLNPGKAAEMFRYEIVVAFDEARRDCVFLKETLSHFPKGRARRVFTRGVDGRVRTADALGMKYRGPLVRPLAGNSSVIATLRVLNVPVVRRVAEQMEGILFATNIAHSDKFYTQPDDLAEWFENHPKLANWMRKTIPTGDLGIKDVDIEEFSGEKILLCTHHGLDRRLPLWDESDGTQRLLDLLPRLKTALDRGVPAILDDVDDGLHADMAAEILLWFRLRENNRNGAQAFVSLHNVGVLDDLEKEELFIVEKDGDGATRLHAAQDVRGMDDRVYAKYRAGVLGGLPQIG